VTYQGQHGDRGAWQNPQGRPEPGAWQNSQDPQVRPEPGAWQNPQRRPEPGAWQNPQRRPEPGAWQNPQNPQVREVPRAYRQDGHRDQRHGGAEGNERLTVMTGAVLLVLLAAEGITILRLGRLLTLHFFIGMLLLGPVALKAGSVTYRFYRYYTGHGPYRRKGPPAPLLRLIGPFVMLLTACVFGSGIMLAVAGPAGRQPWLTLHKASFVLWFGVMAIHVLAYLPRLPRLLFAEARGVDRSPDDGPGYYGGRPATRTAQLLGGRGVRLSLLVASLVAGLAIALLTVHLAGAWESPGGFFYHP
jgi:hypothetical protein